MKSHPLTPIESCGLFDIDMYDAYEAHFYGLHIRALCSISAVRL